MAGRILIVDDDPFICDAVELILTGAGHTVSSVNDGKSAIESIRALMPSLILLDVRMPGISGLDTLTSLRRAGVSVPILMMTADNSPGTLQEVMFLGGSGYVLKPFDADDLIARVEQTLAEAAAPTPAKRPLRRGI
ncbi:response regulator [uncultured Brevundimonas sp.]|uniref:response regulator transcription factor n=1 Tax=uncultured Brevundimonas sp. TaxID=213418 RepID=UPI0030ED7BE2|tara:strand:+ start:826 stop:1233 length:408 start_codon:yes stop_codon:yes gene_type:complete